MILDVVFAGGQVVVDVVVETALLLETGGIGECLLFEAATLLRRRELILGLCVVAMLLVVEETKIVLLLEIRRLLVEGFARLLAVRRGGRWSFRRRRGRGGRRRTASALTTQKGQEILLLAAELAVLCLQSGRGRRGRAIVAEKLILIVNQLRIGERTRRLIVVDRIVVVEESPARTGLGAERIATRLVIVLIVIVVAVEWRRHRHHRVRYLRLCRRRHTVEFMIGRRELRPRLIVALLVLLLQRSDRRFAAIDRIVIGRLPCELIVLCSRVCRIHHRRRQ